MARDYKVVKKTSKGEIIFDDGKYSFVPTNYTPYKYKSYKSLGNLLAKVKI